jgi:hypothetical protein
MCVYTGKLLLFQIVCEGPNQTSRKILEFTSTTKPCCSQGLHSGKKPTNNVTCEVQTKDIKHNI